MGDIAIFCSALVYGGDGGGISPLLSLVSIYLHGLRSRGFVERRQVFLE